MLVEHLNPRELEGSMEVKKSEEEVFKPAGNRHHYRQHCHKDYCIHIKGTRNFSVTEFPLKYNIKDDSKDQEITN